MIYSKRAATTFAMAIVLAGHAQAGSLVTPRLASVMNFRDVAGTTQAYSTAKNGEMRAGIFYRSDALNALSSVDKATLQGLGVRNIFDVRTPSEIARYPDANIPGARWTNIDVMGDYYSRVGMTFNPANAEAARQTMLQINGALVSDASIRGQYGNLLRGLAAADPAALFHCSAGKDRTGWAAYLLHTIAGVSEEQKMRDYMASNDYFAALLSKQDPNSRFYPMAIVDPSYLQASLNEVGQRYGSIDAYLKQGLGLDQETIYVLRGKMVRYRSLPGEAAMTGNAAAGAAFLRELQNSSLSGTYSEYNYFLQSAIDSGTLGGIEKLVGGQIHADAASYLLRQPQRIAEVEPSFAAGYELEIGESRFWLNGLASYLRTDGDTGFAGSNEQTVGTQLGAAHRLNEHMAMRMAFTYGNGSVSGAGASAKTDLSQFGMGARYGFESLDQGMFIDAYGSAGYVNYDSERNLGVLGAATGQTDGGLYNLAAAVGYRARAEDLWIEPRMGLNISRLDLGGFQEKGGELALGVNGINETRSSFNARLAMGSEIKMSDGWEIRPAVVLGYERVLGDPNITGNGNVLGYSVAQNAVFNGRDIFSAGLDFQAQRDNLTIGLAVNTLGNGDSHGVSGKLSVALRF